MEARSLADLDERRKREQGVDDQSPMRLRMEKFIREQQEHIVSELEMIDGKRFQRDEWQRPHGGGGLSCVHPGMYGIFAVIEAVRQLRGDCGERQVANAKTAVAHGNGGTLSSQATAILGLEEVL